MKALITGDFILDNHLIKGTRMFTSSSENEPGTRIQTLFGGAYLTYDLLKGFLEFEKKKAKELKAVKEKEWANSSDEGIKSEIKKGIEVFKEISNIKLECNLNEKEFNKLSFEQTELQSYIEWDWNKTEKKWNYTSLGYGNKTPEDPDISKFLQNEYESPDIIIIDEANLGFRKLDLKISDKTVILKMAYPFCEGNLWSDLTGNNKLYTIVTLENLRRYDVKVSNAISWEQTALDLCFEITRNERLSQLLKSTCLIIQIGSAGAICIHPDKEIKNSTFELIFDPLNMEDEWEQNKGRSIGSGSAFLAGFMRSFLMTLLTSEKKIQEFKPDFRKIICAGLNHIRVLNENRLIFNEEGKTELNPVKKMVEAKSDFPHYYSNAFVPSPYIHNEGKANGINISYLKNNKWTILENNYFSENSPSDPYFSLARNIAFEGPGMAQYAPSIKFGNFISLDRSEIESLRNIKQLVLNYRDTKKIERPLNIAVFGAPGAGKSFAVKQMAKSIINEKEVCFLEYNLSQLNNPAQLTGAFHSVRDAVLNGKLPFVFWDEFDSNNLSWLAELIAPMQDGKFLENGVLHPLGKCVFIFAGGTSYTMKEFDPSYFLLSEEEWKNYFPDENDRRKEKEKREEKVVGFKMKKGPDFLSRINGYLDVQGPNKRLVCCGSKKEREEDQTDVCYPIRRALFIRGVLGLKDGEKLKMDWGLLSAFLEISEYIRGSRSLERLLNQLTLKTKDTIIRSDLPSDEIIAMNVDYDDFMQKLYKDRKEEEFAEKIAVQIHNTWMKFNVIGSTFYNEYKKLNYNGRISNIVAAKRLPYIIAQSKIFKLEDKNNESIDAATAFANYIKISEDKTINEDLEFLANLEHEGWMKERENDGWILGLERSDYLKIHPCVKPYKDLNENDKNKDRDAVRNYVEFLKGSAFKIVRLIQT